MLTTLEKLFFGDIEKGLADPQKDHYTIIGKYFHDMHLMAHYTVGGNNANFHPIGACYRAAIMGIACSIMTNLLVKPIPSSFRNSFRIGLEGGPWVYAASIIYKAAQSWSEGTKGDHSGGQISSGDKKEV